MKGAPWTMADVAGWQVALVDAWGTKASRHGCAVYIARSNQWLVPPWVNELSTLLDERVGGSTPPSHERILEALAFVLDSRREAALTVARLAEWTTTALLAYLTPELEGLALVREAAEAAAREKP